MTFRPVGDEHAIHEAVFIVHFDSSLSPDHFRALDDNRKQWAFLPGRNETRGFGVTVAMPKGTPKVKGIGPSVIASVEYHRGRPDGQKEWAMKATADLIAVNCLSYTRWVSIWERVRGYLEKALRALAKPKFVVTGLSLYYLDQFIWEGNLEDYDAKELFQSEGNYLTPKNFESGALWHCHTGWFTRDGLPEPGRMLTRISIDALEQQEDHVTQIKTELFLNFDKSRSTVAQLFGRKGQKSPPLIDRCMDFMHDRDKQLLSELLVPQMVERISLLTPEDK